MVTLPLGAATSVLLVDADKALGLLPRDNLWQFTLLGQGFHGTVWANALVITDVVEHGSRSVEAPCCLHGLVGGGEQ